MAQVICAGVMVADVLARGVGSDVFSRDCTRVERVQIATGGDAFNQAVNLAQLGISTALLGRVGQDTAGQLLLEQARARDIDVSGVQQIAGRPTSVSIVLIGEDGQRNIIASRAGSNGALCAADILPVKGGVRGASIYSLGSLYGSLSLTGEQAAMGLKAAKCAGMVTVADMMHGDHPLEDAALALQYVDYFLPNCEEACLLTGQEQPENAIRALLELGVGCVVLKMGGEGCLVGTGAGERLQFPACRAKVEDTTGAGDAFAAGFIWGLLEGLPVEVCALRGNAAGAVAVECLGATCGDFTKQALLARMEEAKAVLT